MRPLSEFAGGGVLIKQQLFTADGTFDRPDSMIGETVWLTMIGGGASSGNGGSSAIAGWGGQYIIRMPVDIGDLTSIACIIGLGGIFPTQASAAPPAPGGTTSFGNLASVLGGSPLTYIGGAPGGRSAASNNTSNPNGADTPLGRGGYLLTTAQAASGGGGLILDLQQVWGGDIQGIVKGAQGYGAGGSIGTYNVVAQRTSGVNGAILVEWPEAI